MTRERSNSDRPIRIGEDVARRPVYVWPDGFTISGPDCEGDMHVNGTAWVRSTPEQIARRLGRGWPPVEEEEKAESVEPNPEPAPPKSDEQRLAYALAEEGVIVMGSDGNRCQAHIGSSFQYDGYRGCFIMHDDSMVFGPTFFHRFEAAVDFARTLTLLGYKLAE